MSVSHHIGARNQTPNPGPQQEQAFSMDKPLTVRYDKMWEKKITSVHWFLSLKYLNSIDLNHKEVSLILSKSLDHMTGISFSMVRKCASGLTGE